MKQSINFAFAVSAAQVFEPKHFGDADNFLMYHWDGEAMHFVEVLPNPFITFDEEHGSKRKGVAISDFLAAQDIHVLVSKRFGKNVQVVNQHFLPVMIDKVSKEECFAVLEQYMDDITLELEQKSGPYTLYAIRGGALKRIAIKADE